jgi:hypothetical protein
MESLFEALSKVLGTRRRTQFALISVAIIVFLSFVLYNFLVFLREVDPEAFPESLNRLLSLAPRLFTTLAGVAVGIATVLVFGNVILGLQTESKDYARKISSRELSPTAASIDFKSIGDKTANSRLRRMIDDLREQLAALKDAPAVFDISTPEKLFQASRQRLLDEAVRIDSISRRNLIIGILFSVIALAVLAWPLISATFQQPTGSQDFNIFVWASQYYLPRFAVGLLLQFVGFFFLRLYVANELDLKHNKNEITNLEMKMMGVQLVQVFGDGPSKKEIVKSLAATERNFLIKKNERTISTEVMSEYNDMKGLLEKAIGKLPGKEK